MRLKAGSEAEVGGFLRKSDVTMRIISSTDPNPKELSLEWSCGCAGKISAPVAVATRGAFHVERHETTRPRHQTSNWPSDDTERCLPKKSPDLVMYRNR